MADKGSIPGNINWFRKKKVFFPSEPYISEIFGLIELCLSEKSKVYHRMVLSFYSFHCRAPSVCGRGRCHAECPFKLANLFNLSPFLKIEENLQLDKKMIYFASKFVHLVFT